MQARVRHYRTYRWEGAGLLLPIVEAYAGLCNGATACVPSECGSDHQRPSRVFLPFRLQMERARNVPEEVRLPRLASERRINLISPPEYHQDGW